MKFRYNGKSEVLAHKGAGTNGQYGKTSIPIIFNRGDWVEVSNPADIEFFKSISRPEGSDFEMEKTEQIVDKIKETAKETLKTIKETITGKPKTEEELIEIPKPEKKKERKGSLRLSDLREDK